MSTALLSHFITTIAWRRCPIPRVWFVSSFLQKPQIHSSSTATPAAASSSGDRAQQKNENNNHQKQHFDDIYRAENPVPYKEQILDALEYVSDDFNQAAFDFWILPWALRQHKTTADAATAANMSGRRPRMLHLVDLGACFGNTTMATLYGMSYAAIRDNWTSAEACRNIAGRRRFLAQTMAIDRSAPALAYGKQVGLYNDTIVADINKMSGETKERVLATMAAADILISAGALIYFDPVAIDEMIQAFCGNSSNCNEKEGYVLVNFLHPFAVEQADVMKRLLLRHLDFVGSRAARHRRVSAQEQNHYPGEEWVLVEIWVLQRRRHNQQV